MCPGVSIGHCQELSALLLSVLPGPAPACLFSWFCRPGRPGISCHALCWLEAPCGQVSDGTGPISVPEHGAQSLALRRCLVDTSEAQRTETRVELGIVSFIRPLWLGLGCSTLAPGYSACPGVGLVPRPTPPWTACPGAIVVLPVSSEAQTLPYPALWPPSFAFSLLTGWRACCLLRHSSCCFRRSLQGTGVVCGSRGWRLSSGGKMGALVGGCL